MAFIKLKRPQEIVDNIEKIKKGDLIFFVLPKDRNSINGKHFLIGTAMADVEISNTVKTAEKRYAIHLLIGDTFKTVVYDKMYYERRKKTFVVYKIFMPYESFIISWLAATYKFKGF